MSTAEDDDEKTLAGPLRPGRPRPPAAPADVVETGLQADRRRARAGAEQPGHTLPAGTRLRDYEITGLIGEGGFGIVYLAWDHSLQRRVAIKEYMPASMAARVNGSSAIVVKSERHLDTFRAGLKSFVNEARLLARFDHPSLVKVYRFWEENGTAYMVMPYYEGPTLKAALAALGRPPREDELRAWLTPLLDALAVMHAAQCYHRDIAPDNILLTARGPLLLDFGAARRVIGDMTHAITVVLKPGYAPIEQYGEVASMAQGAWTDLYALACVVYFAIVGRTPTSSVERLMDDRLEPLAVSAAGRYGDAFLRAIDAALAVRPADRPQTERQFRALLDAGRPPPSPPARAAIPVVAPAMRADPAAHEPTQVQPRGAAPAAVAGARAASAESGAAAATASARRPKGRWLGFGLLGAAVLAAALLGVLRLRGGSMPAGRAASAPPVSAAASTVNAVPPVRPVAIDRPPPVEGSRASAPAAHTPVAQVPVPQVPTAQVPTAQVPTAQVPTAQVPTAQVPATELPAEQGRHEAAPLTAARSRTAPAAAGAGIEPQADAAAATAKDAASRPPRTPRPRRESVPARSEATETVAAPHAAPSGTRCSDILQKASLEPLTAAETAYLKKECR